jgi:uncharacterized membrane protein
MTNELLLIISILVTYGGVILFYRFFGKNGLLDTPFIYWARTISEKHHGKDQND